MTNNVFYSDVTYKPYFDMRKFENSIYNKEIIREKRINVRKKQKVLDNILTFFVAVLTIASMSLAFMLGYQYIKISGVDTEIKRLENAIETNRKKAEEISDSLDQVVKYDELKMKAFLDLNMILPTDKNIIYFDKSDQGFVRQYENIR